jgi:hypothetical protein
MRKILSVVLVVFVTATVVSPKPKTRVFKKSCSIVFPAAEKMSSEKPYHILLDGKADMILRVQTGSYWKAGASDIDVQFTSNEDGTCTVTDNSPYSGPRRNGTVFLDRLEKLVNE